jgi:hypothetical protein
MKKIVLFLMIVANVSFFMPGCGNEEKPLAPYSGSPDLSTINIEQGSFTPKITWLGGYVSVLGVNRGSHARLDSSLIMLIRTDGNNLHYPATFGTIPQNAQDLTSQYGGRSQPRLIEDNTYTIWVMKQDVWSQMTAHAGKVMRVGPELPRGSIAAENDTVSICPASYSDKTLPLDVYVNYENIRSLGKLAELKLIETDTGNVPVISWQLKQAGVTEIQVAAMGVVNGPQYSPTEVVWEIWSEDMVDGKPVYGKSNIISPPMLAGAEVAGTKAFYQMPAEGLQRNRDYYIWIANKGWDGIKHSRSADFYAYLTFHTF